MNVNEQAYLYSKENLMNNFSFIQEQTCSLFKTGGMESKVLGFKFL